MGHGMITLVNSTINSSAAHDRALHRKEVKQTRFELLHGGADVPKPVQDLVLSLNGFNGQIDSDKILWRTRPGAQTTITYRNTDVALFLIPQGLHTLGGIRISSLSNTPGALADSIKRRTDVQEKMKLGNLNDVINVLRFQSQESGWDLHTQGSTYIRLNREPLYLVSPEFEVKTLNGNETIVNLNEGTNGNAENADVYGIADKILGHYLSS